MAWYIAITGPSILLVAAPFINNYKMLNVGLFFQSLFFVPFLILVWAYIKFAWMIILNIMSGDVLLDRIDEK